MSVKKIVSLIFRIIISIALLYFLLQSTSIHEIKDVLINADHKLMLLGILIYLVGQVMSAYKWKILAEAIDFKNKLFEYFDYYFIGMFFNLFLPTTIGGDVAKCYYLSKNDSRDRRAPAVYSVLADRYSGVIVIVWMATIAMLSPLGNNVQIGYKLLMITLSILIIIITPLFPNVLMIYFKRKKWARLLLKDTKPYFNDAKLVIKVLSWSFLFHCSIILIHIIIAQAIGVKIPALYFFIAYPMSAIAGFIPLSFNGLGPREAAYTIFFSFIGIKQSQAMAFGIVWFAIVLCSSLTGIIFYIKGKHTPVPEQFDFIPEDDESDLDQSNIEINENNAKTQTI